MLPNLFGFLWPRKMNQCLIVINHLMKPQICPGGVLTPRSGTTDLHNEFPRVTWEKLNSYNKGWLTGLLERWAAGRCLTLSSWFGYAVALCWEIRIGIHKYNAKCAGKQIKMLILMHMYVELCWGLNHSHLLQCRAVVKAGQILYLVVRQLPTTMHKAHTQSTHKHSDQLWIYSVGNYGGDRIIWVNSRLCEQGDIAGQ